MPYDEYDYSRADPRSADLRQRLDGIVMVILLGGAILFFVGALMICGGAA